MWGDKVNHYGLMLNLNVGVTVLIDFNNEGTPKAILIIHKRIMKQFYVFILYLVERTPVLNVYQLKIC